MSSSDKKARSSDKKAKSSDKKAKSVTDSVKGGVKGNAGELHQLNVGDVPTLTTQQGGPVSDNQNALSAGPRGHLLLEDHIFREKLFHFDHERIPERVVHARGSGAHGFFETYDSLSHLTCADIFQRAGERTPAFVRFSTVGGSKGSFDLARDVRGFAVKLYTREGNWDIVGNNMPVFFIQDPMKFPDVVHAVKEEPDRGFPQAQSAHDNFWDFISLMPESMHMIMWKMSDRSIPRSFRFMEGFGVHSFRMINADGESVFVKFHWKPKLGLQSVLWEEAVKINGADPDFHRRDLWDAITAGDFPEWELGLQIFDDEFAEQFEFDILDPTKIIPEEQVPVMPVGRLVLDRVVDNFFAETEQVAFCTQNIVKGIDHSDDPLLQGRNFSYLDTQLKRLGGPNFTHLPINAPKCPVHNFHQDGHMAFHNPKGRVNYEPNSWGEESDEQGGPRACHKRGFTSYPQTVTGTKTRTRSETFADHYSQARQFYISQTAVEQLHLAKALGFELSKVETERIRVRMVSHLLNIDQGLAESVARMLGIDPLPAPAEAARPTRMDLPPSSKLSIHKNGPQRFAGRKIGILASAGACGATFAGLESAIKFEGAMYDILAPQVGELLLNNGRSVNIDKRVEGGPSVLYDAVAVLGGDDAGGELSGHPEAQNFVRDAFNHQKFIAFADAALPLLRNAGISDGLDEGCMNLSGDGTADLFIAACRQVRQWDRVPG